jgi:RHS repeat-associated protein
MGSDWFHYDLVGRLVQGTARNGTRRQDYSYDRYGNLTGVTTWTGGSPLIRDLATSGLTNRLTTMGASYDAAGRMLQGGGTGEVYGWDGLNMLRTYDRPGQNLIHFYTTGEERLLTYDVGTSTSTFRLRDLSGKVLREFKRDGSGWSWQKDNIYRDGQLLATEVPGGRMHYHLDHLGTPRLITAASGTRRGSHVYYGFGEEAGTVSEDLDPMKFTGHERDLTGGITSDAAPNIDYMHARYYSAFMGRFLSVDPVLDIKQATKNPQGWNRYAYVLNNPLRFTDPTGRQVACANDPKDCRREPPPPPPPPLTKGTLTLGVTVQGTAKTLSGSVTAAVNVDRQGEVAGSVTYGRGVTTNPASGLVVGVTGSVTNANSVLSLAGKGTEASATAGRKLGITIGRVDGPQGNGTYSGGEVTIGAGVQTPAGTFQLTTTWMITRTQVMNGMTNVYAGTEQAAREWVMTSLPDYPE